MPSALPSSDIFGRGWRCRAAIATAGAFALVVASHLLWSSQAWRAQWLLVGALFVVGVAGRGAWPAWRATGWAGALALAGLLAAQVASVVGGLQHGASFSGATWAMARGLAGVFGIAVLAAVMAGDPRWHKVAKFTGLAVLLSVLAGSLGGYLISVENHIDLGGNAQWFDPMRLAAVWPTRLLTAPWGQVAWQHANVAGYYFALALVILLESIARRKTRHLLPWCALAVALVAAVYLTASRGAGLMVVSALVLILPGRPWRVAVVTAAVVACGLAAGHAALHAKQQKILAAIESQQAAEYPVKLTFERARTTDHNARYLKRADAGRFKAYQELWRENRESPWFGRGHAAADKPLLYLNQEHSSFLTTLRTSGIVGSLGHLLVLGAAAWAATIAFIRGTRWPAVFFTAAMAGILFDRTTVLALTGYYEFSAHWAAVSLALLAVKTSEPKLRNAIQG